ncbi:multidrug transporter subunit MdtD [Pandoraea nosoerga]|nr:multidrug transporter subunit MdtD [Pandoraea nosoerga]MBN4665379.1 multidrug transporter subunit MdtD [Pandoraea nosoerga]MBN4674904.1 multidrug transporter subunit MdtD [Pandoraea nosoerga]MBN4680220.1 multidrug transporter subunit MdtD [Pandoraea nosoerga]MBN4744547.1 multidrug transporter subunit MdtD [Pandoraea nosoerga]
MLSLNSSRRRRRPAASSSRRMKQDTTLTALLWIVAAGFFMQALDTTIVNTALPAMAASLGENPLRMQPVVVAYSLTMAMLTPASGWLADRFGTQRVYFVAILLFVLGSICCAMAHTLAQLVLARVLQGAGGSMLLPVGRLAVLRTFPAERYLAALAFVSIAGQVGPMIGPVLGGWLVQVASWHWIFLINVPIGVVGSLAVRRYLPRPAKDELTHTGFDWPGFALLSAAMVSFTLALDHPFSDTGWDVSVGLALLCVATTLGYWPYARRCAAPLFPLELFETRSFSLGLLGNLVARIGSSAVPFLLPLLLQVAMGYSPLASGLMMLPVALSGVVVKRMVTPLVQRYGYTRFLIVNTVVVGASIASFALFGPGWPVWLGLVQLAVFGGANSMQFAAMNSVTLKDLGARRASAGNGLFSMAQMLALGLGVTIGGQLLALFGHLAGRAGEAGASGAVAGFRLTFVCVGLITLASALVFRRVEDAAAARRSGGASGASATDLKP